VRFTLSYRDVEDLLAERGAEVSYETIRRWAITFGPPIARRLRARRPKPHCRWYLDEMFVRIGGKRMYLWRAIDAESEVWRCWSRPSGTNELPESSFVSS
jgi:putative transposase